LGRIAKLYEIEAAIRGRPPDERASVRGARAGPLLEQIKVGLEATLAKVSTKSALARSRSRKPTSLATLGLRRASATDVSFLPALEQFLAGEG
jgi:hypothetical protein